MTKFILLSYLLFNVFVSSSQQRLAKTSFAKGTLFGYYGYNRSIFSNSTLNFSGPGYEFSLKGVAAKDAPFMVDPGQQLNPIKATTGQYTVRAGYYFKNHYSLSLGYDKLKYHLVDGDAILLSGQYNPLNKNAIDSNQIPYINQPHNLDLSTFNYTNSGLNYLRLEIARADQWLAAGSRQQLILTTVFGIGCGGLISDNLFLMEGKQEGKTRSFSGFAFSANVGVRLEFFKHLFIQSNLSGGYMTQTGVRTSEMDLNSFASQHFTYLQFDTNLGFFLYLPSPDKCNTCPKW
jgi:hypothetical protein